MKEIKIVSRWDSSKVLLCGKYESIKDCLEKNRGANLGGANLGGADLRSANLGGADLRSADLGGAYLGGAYLRGANLGGAYLRSANLRSAYLGGADLRSADLRSADLGGAYLRSVDLGDADLRSADLGGAYLRSAKNYLSSHDFFQEVIRRQPVKTFTQAEWASIAQIIIHKLCWDTIKNKHKTSAMRVFKKCSKVGFDEWEKHFKELK